jgi:hypothetical protein
MATPPTQQEIRTLAKYLADTNVTYAEARKRLLREYFLAELKEIENDKNTDPIYLDLKITRLAKVVGGILIGLD